MTGRPERGWPVPSGRGNATAVSRRRFLGAASTAVVASIAGCTGGDGGDAGAGADVVAGPGGRLVFEPERVTVSAGDAVTWFFDSPGHNVCGRPGDSEAVSLPAGAEPFATYGPDQPPLTLVAAGETYEHAFPVPGTYVYACVPHVSAGMVGRIEVEA